METQLTNGLENIKTQYLTGEEALKRLQEMEHKHNISLYDMNDTFKIADGKIKYTVADIDKLVQEQLEFKKLANQGTKKLAQSSNEEVLKPFGVEDKTPIKQTAVPSSPVNLKGNYKPDSTKIIPSNKVYELIGKLEKKYKIEVIDFTEAMDIIDGTKKLTEADVFKLFQDKTGMSTDNIYEQFTYATKQMENAKALAKEEFDFQNKFTEQTKKINSLDPQANQKFDILQQKTKLEKQLMEMAHDKGLTLDEYIKSLNQLEAIDPQLHSSLMKKAQEISYKASMAEPQVTQLMKTLEENGARLEGLSHRFKSEDSIARKIISWCKYSGVSENAIDSYGDAINDSLRYTLILNEATYSQGVYSSLKKLMDNGYQVDAINNLWGNSTYQGLNVTLKNSNGLKIELQFHTDASYLTKESYNHLYYELARSSGASPQERELANQIMKLNQTLNVKTIDDMVSLNQYDIIENAKKFTSFTQPIAKKYTNYSEFTSHYQSQRQQWLNSLSDNDKKIIYAYVGESVEQAGNYKAVNGLLRGTLIDTKKKIISWRGTGGYLNTMSFAEFKSNYGMSVSDFVKLQTQAADDLNKVISRMALDERTILTRGVNWDALGDYGIKQGDSAQTIMKKLTANGGIYSDPGFMSSSPVPTYITSSKPIQLVMDCDAGTKVADLSYFNSGETEVLFGAGQKFAVEGVTEENNQILIHLKTIN